MKIEQNKKYLFVCYANISRSKYAEGWFLSRAINSGIKIEVKSAGVNAETFGKGTQISQQAVDWADYIIVMEEWMIKDIQRCYDADPDKFRNLEIPDVLSSRIQDSQSLDNYSSQELEDYVKRNAKRDNEFRIGTKTFERLLEGKLERILI